MVLRQSNPEANGERKNVTLAFLMMQLRRPRDRALNQREVAHAVGAAEPRYLFFVGFQNVVEVEPQGLTWRGIQATSRSGR